MMLPVLGGISGSYKTIFNKYLISLCCLYTDNPRAIIEFGSYRSHDRILSWRELYVMPPE
jgi:hypothetical protein